MSDLTSLVIPRGFRFGATKAGVKASGRADFALIVADAPASAAAAFTANRVIAAPLIVDKEHLKATGGKVRVVATNAGNANCAAGKAGLDAAHATCEAAAKVFGCKKEEVFPCSTGVIGVPLPAQKLIDALPGLAARIGAESDKFLEAAQAILTTDTVEKTAFARIDAGQDGREIRIAAFCKGAGMIFPQLAPHATMLVYILTDAEIEPAVLQGYLNPAIERSFNRISVDGDTSTNDTVLLLALGNTLAPIRGDDVPVFAQAVREVCAGLARMIVDDGEGTTHTITIDVEGCTDRAEARKIAEAVAHSPLVKTAIAGADPNWGRIVSAAGYAGIPFEESQMSLWLNGMPLYERGLPLPFDEAAASASIRAQRETHIRLLFTRGEESIRFWTTDLTAEYVRLNADYTT